MGQQLDSGQAAVFYRKACDMWDYISSTPEDEVRDRPSAVRNLVLGRLREALRCDPGHLPAREMLVRLMAEELGAFVEAFPEADELARRAPDNTAFQELREKIRHRAKKDSADIPDA
jgi:hypothetical protein